MCRASETLKTEVLKNAYKNLYQKFKSGSKNKRNVSLKFFWPSQVILS